MTARKRAPEDSYPHDLAGGEVLPPEAAPAELVAAWRRHEEDEHAALLEENAGKPSPLLAGATAPRWRMAGSLAVLLEEADAANPARDKRSDGGVGDLRHQANWTGSDHNPWLVHQGVGVVRARDFDVDGLDVPEAFGRIRLAVLDGRLPQMLGGGYLIVNAAITTPDFSTWVEYHGANPHVTHGHVSVGTDPARFDDRRPWNIWAPQAAPAPARPVAPVPTPSGGTDARGSGLGFRADVGDVGPRIAALQSFLRTRYPLYAKHLIPDGVYGPATAKVIAEYARRSAIRGADGRNVGPQLARSLYVAGFRG